MANAPIWSIPLTEEVIKTLQARLVKEGKPVHFTNKRGDTVEMITSKVYHKQINNIHKPHYWNFDMETIRLIEQNTGLKAHISE